jgi:tight adherence protein C
MSPVVALSLALGIGLGCGLWLMLMALPRFGAVPLYQRVAPYIADVSPIAFDDATRRSPLSRGGYPQVVHTAFTSLAGYVERNPSNAALTLSLHRAGWSLTASEFRVRRLMWTALALAVGAVIDAGLGLASQLTPVTLVVLPLVTSTTGYVLCTLRVQRAAAARVRHIEEELPAIWEFISLCVTAGESLPDALARVVRLGRGSAVEELGTTLARVESGVQLGTALAYLAQRLQISALSRGVEQVVGALNKGTPLAGVLQEQALDAREDTKRALLESAGKKEVAMLVPLVFLILPVTILFAVFPGLLVIQSGF